MAGFLLRTLGELELENCLNLMSLSLLRLWKTAEYNTWGDKAYQYLKDKSLDIINLYLIMLITICHLEDGIGLN